MKSNNIIHLSVVVSVAFWILESLMHYKVFDHGHGFELIPHDPNELWMRSLICLLIIAFGIYAHFMVKKIIQYEKNQVETLKLTMRTVQDIVCNCLNEQQLMLIEMKKACPEKIKLLGTYENLIFSTAESLNKIANMKDIKTKRLSSGMLSLDLESSC